MRFVEQVLIFAKEFDLAFVLELKANRIAVPGDSTLRPHAPSTNSTVTLAEEIRSLVAKSDSSNSGRGLCLESCLHFILGIGAQFDSQ